MEIRFPHISVLRAISYCLFSNSSPTSHSPRHQASRVVVVLKGLLSVQNCTQCTVLLGCFFPCYLMDSHHVVLNLIVTLEYLFGFVQETTLWYVTSTILESYNCPNSVKRLPRVKALPFIPIRPSSSYPSQSASSRKSCFLLNQTLKY